MPLSAVASVAALRGEIAGLDQKVTLLGGEEQEYVHLDNATCTPAFRRGLEKVQESLNWYGDVEHGSGYKALVSKRMYSRACEATLAFTGASSETSTVYYGKNSTEVLDILARCIRWEPGDVVLTSEVNAPERNLLWHEKAQVVSAGVDENGCFRLDDLEKKLLRFAGRVKLVVVPGVSPLTGAVAPLQAVAELAHYFRASMLLDGGQLAAHRPIRMGQPGTRAHIDFVTFSGQKLYAPLGIAVLVGPRAYLSKMLPRAGTPNLTGMAALTASMEILQQAGMDAVSERERELSCQARKRISQVAGCHVVGCAAPENANGDNSGVGYLSFSIDGLPPARLAAMLSFEAGVGVECIRLPGQPDGLVRASFGCYNNGADVERLVEGVTRAAQGKMSGDYVLDPHSGLYAPRGFDPAELDQYLPI